MIMAATGEKAEDLKAALDTLKADVAGLKEDIKGLAGAVRNVGKDRLTSAKEAVIEKAKAVEDSAERKVVGAYENVREAGEQALSATRHTIEDRPLTTALGAFLAGMLFAKLMWKD
jgi:predicted  nucleic acid-binding Zn-ribbon protein